jgi:hypothetical protein
MYFSLDVFVQRTGLVGTQQLGLHHGAVDVHREFVDVRPGRQREEIGAFQLLRIGVVKFLVNGGGRNLIVDVHGDVVIRHLQRRKGKMPRHPPIGRRIVNHNEPIRPAPVGRRKQRRQSHQKAQDVKNSFHCGLSMLD